MLCARTAGAAAYMLLACVLVCFSCGTYSVLQSSLLTATQTINPVLYPLFSKVDTSSSAVTATQSHGDRDDRIVGNAHESYYRLWRLYDWVADGYAAPRQHTSEQLRVPALYVHGNAGSYFCARSMARFVYEANAQQRRHAVRALDMHVKQSLHRQLYNDNNNNSNSYNNNNDTTVVITPAMRQRAEEALVHAQMPLLAVELFSLDFLEESNVHSGVLMMKQARYLAHAMQALLAQFVHTYTPLLQPPSHDNDNNNSNNDDDDKRRAVARAVRVVRSVEHEYVQSLCNNMLFDKDAVVCRRARALLARYDSRTRLRAEVARVRARGLWVWGESVGGVVALLAAVLQPRVVAGVVLVGTPVQQLPLYLDDAAVHVYDVLARAVLCDTDGNDDDDDDNNAAAAMDEAVLHAALALPSPLTALRYLHTRPARVLASRLSRTALLSINGGALDHIVTSTSTHLHTRIALASRCSSNCSSSRRRCGSHDGGGGHTPSRAARRDVSTEELRGCGMPMDHRGLVYGAQFLLYAARSLVQAALLPHATAHMAREDAMPAVTRERLWPTVDEALSPSRESAWRFAVALHDTSDGGYVWRANNNNDSSNSNDDSTTLVRVCTHNAVPVRLADVPAITDDATDNAASSRVLQVMLGVTTYAPEAVHAPELHFYDDAALTRPLHGVVTGTATVTTATSKDTLHATAATRLHLPHKRRDTAAIDGHTLRTAISFRLARTTTAMTTTAMTTTAAHDDDARVVWPQFCFYANTQTHSEAAGQASNTRLAAAAAATTTSTARAQHSFVQYTRIDATALVGHPQQQQQPSSRRPLRVVYGDAYALVDGADALTQEAALTVHTPAASAVSPVTLCGSLDVFARMLHGGRSDNKDDHDDDNDDDDDDEDAVTAVSRAHVQYFFGPFVPSQRRFRYTWRPPNAFPPRTDAVYVIYALGDVPSASAAVTTSEHASSPPQQQQQHVRVELRDTQALAQCGAWLPCVVRRLRAWPQRWLLYLLTNSEMGKLLSSYGLLWFVLMHAFGVMDRAFAAATAAAVVVTQPPWLLRRLRALAPPHPLCASLIAVSVLETAASAAVHALLPACADVAHDAAGDTPMTWSRRVAMVLLYALPPSWQACQCGWRRMHATRWPWLTYKLASIYLGFCIAAVAQVLLACIAAAVGVAGLPVSRLLLRPLLTRAPRVGACVLALAWAAPLATAAVCPWLPSCYVYLLSLALLYVALAALPRRVCRVAGSRHSADSTGCRYWRVCMLSTTAIFFAAYADGLLLVVRNHVTLRGAPAVLSDSSRYARTPARHVIFALVHAGVAVLYATVYAVVRSEATLSAATTTTATAAAATTAKMTTTTHKAWSSVHATCAVNADATDAGNGHVATTSAAAATLRRRRRLLLPQRAHDDLHNGNNNNNNNNNDSDDDDKSRRCRERAGYVLGDVCRRWRWLRVLTHHGQSVLLLLAVWLCVVTLRRPLEGQVALTGLLLLYGYQLCFVVHSW